MQDQVKECYDEKCLAFGRRHFHIVSNDGSYIKFIVDKPKINVITDRSDDYADTRR